MFKEHRKCEYEGEIHGRHKNMQIKCLEIKQNESGRIDRINNSLDNEEENISEPAIAAMGTALG
jgi:hypothetical protein